MSAATDREGVVDLAKYTDQRVRVRFQGGREVEGVLKGFDKIDNVVLDECTEFLRDPTDPYKLSDETRPLGLVVCKGTQIALLAPCDGMEEIANPFVGDEDEEGEA
jgi:U6 snRNA-associated Sm-like protein LSm7